MSEPIDAAHHQLLTVFIIYDEIIIRPAGCTITPSVARRRRRIEITVERWSARRGKQTMGHPKRRRHLRIDESFWAWLDSPDTPMHVAALAVFESDNEPTSAVVKRVMAGFRARTDVHPRFRTVIRMRRFPRRARRELVDHLDLDLHMRHHVLPDTDDEHALAQLISHLQSKRLDAGRPMWELHVIEVLHGNRFALYVKAHHSLVNGVDAVRMLGRSLTPAADAITPTPLWTIDGPRPRLTTATGSGRARASITEHVSLLFAASKAVARLCRPRRGDSPLTSPFAARRSRINVDTGPQRRVRTVSMDLNKLKRLAQASETSVNDVALAACSTALRRYLLDIGELPAKPLIAGCPVSIAAPEGSAADSSIGIMFADLATNRADAVARLRTIARSTRAAKDHQAALPHRALLPYSILAMGSHTLRQIAPGAVEHMPPAFNLIISNVPGPPQPLYLAGARMVELHPLSLLFKGEALNITALSYNDRMNFGLTACASALPQVDLIARYLEDAVAELETHYASTFPDLSRPA
ncbi:wax ester/triacylglycerol synthase family O-acyltransferase [Nocardia sp. CA-120079]|uniref:wax ester/triacylglycerol synthase family O-acyltransferase n=1 Tax=Nocardia sp. CA-120079 TaxID=3239974 RepID=UPI003D974F2D